MKLENWAILSEQRLKYWSVPHTKLWYDFRRLRSYPSHIKHFYSAVFVLFSVQYEGETE